MGSVWQRWRRAWHNPIWQGGMVAFAHQPTYRSHSLNYVATLAAVLLITWPKEAFLNVRDLPFAYNALGVVTLIISAYLNIAQGATPLLGSPYVRLHDWLALAPVSTRTFLHGYVASSSLALLLFWALGLPLVLLAAHVCGEPWHHLGAGLLIILVCAGSYRLVGIMLLVCFERDEFVLYLLVRLCYVALMLGTGFVLPLANPVLAFTDASLWSPRLPQIALPGMTLRGWVVTVALHLLLAGAGFIIAWLRIRWVRRHAAPSPLGAAQRMYG